MADNKEKLDKDILEVTVHSLMDTLAGVEEELELQERLLPLLIMLGMVVMD